MFEMVKVDLSKHLPPNTYVYFSAFMPGLFFEFSILLGNPDLIHKLTKSQAGLGFDRYLTLFMGLFFAFVIGNAFMLLVALIQYGLGRIYLRGLWLWGLFQKHILLRFLIFLIHRRSKVSDSMANPKPPPRQLPWWVIRLHILTQNEVQGIPSENSKNEYTWWVTLVKQLFLKRFGIPEEKLPDADFGPLQSVLISSSAEEVRGSVFMNASEATGWAALVASRLAPVVWVKWYIIFTIFLIVNGLLGDYFLAKRLNNPRFGNMLRLRAILRDFPKIQPDGCVEQNSGNPVGEI